MQFNIITAILIIALAGCSDLPPKPKQPDESRRVPVNKQMRIDMKKTGATQ